MADVLQEYAPTNESVYSFLRKQAKQYKSQTAISFYGRRISYRTLFAKIDEVAKALVALGVTKDDVVASSLPGCPEGVYLLYAVNKIGAIYCAFDCRAKSEEIKETIKTFSPKLCVVPSFQLSQFRDIRECTTVFLSPIHSLGAMEKLYSIPTDLFTGRTFLRARNWSIFSYDQFIRQGKAVALGKTQSSTQNIFGYFYTSGTTYGRKSVILTNENINAAVTIHRLRNTRIQSGQSMLNIMPLFTCYSVTLATHLPLCYGVTVKLIPLLNPKKMKKVLLKEKPNYIITVPAHWEFFIKEDFKDCDLSFLFSIVIGGDTMHPAYRKKLEEILREHGAGDTLQFGYGLSETTSTAVSAFSAPENSVGYALPYMQVAICHPETGEPLPAGEKGEICICGPTLCKGYFREKELTDKLLRKHSDGNLWLHSSDCGYLDETGALYFCERYKRMYVRFDGTKVSPYSIEQGLSACELVEECLVVAVTDEAHSHGKCAKAFVVLKEGEDKIDAAFKLQKYCEKYMDEHMQPKQIVIVSRLPHTANGKLEYFEKTS